MSFLRPLSVRIIDCVKEGRRVSLDCRSTPFSVSVGGRGALRGAMPKLCKPARSARGSQPALSSSGVIGP